MKKLKELRIDNTDINEINIEQLPSSLEQVYYSTELRPYCQLTKFVPRLEKKLGRFNLCRKCHQPNTNIKWCQPCAEQEWKNLTGQELVEKFIEQQKLRGEDNKLQWIPYEKFTNIEYLAEGGFSKIYNTKWNNKDVVLKILTNSQNITQEFLQEIANTKLVDGGVNIVAKCHGISQDPTTKNYIMVMEYIKDGNLRVFLSENAQRLNWESKLAKLMNIAYGLNIIHDQDLVHRDLHSGNILNDNTRSYITDLGLSQPANAQKEEDKIFGVLPYIAPEVLNKKPYTKKSDIYSLGTIAYEVLSCCPPYHDTPHDADLALNICQGLRPQFPKQVKYPQLLADLINKCWDADPKKRPSAKELYSNLYYWYKEIEDKKDTEFTQQIQAVEVHNQTLPTKIRYPKYEIHQGACYHSQAINTQQINQLLKSKQQYGGSKNIDLDLDNFNLDELNIQEDPREQSSTQAQQEIPSK